MTTFAAIPTIYKGVQFRSRLEARWAAYWDIVGFHWAYEPFDLSGYIPDFLLSITHPVNDRCYECGWFDAEQTNTGVGCSRIVEIKPAMEISGLIEAARKLDNTGWNGRAFVYGSSPSIGLRRYMDSVYGWGWRFETRVEPPGDVWTQAGNLVQYKGPQAETRG